MDEALDTSDLGLDGVSTHEELAALLRQVRVRADRPSLRILEAKTRHGSTPLSKTLLADMLNGVRFPSKAVMIAFLQACRVQDSDMELWRRTWERVAYDEERQPGWTTPNSWQFSDPGPVILICAQLPSGITSPLGDPADPNYTELLSYGDLDAMVELYGHIRAENSTMNVSFKLSSQLGRDALSGHVVVLGGIAWNEITEQISEMLPLPIRQIEDPAVKTGEIFVVQHEGKERKFLPKWASVHGKLKEDVGLIVRTPNPLNSDRTLTICNGIHSRGVLGAVRTLTDAQLRESNERYIVENFADPSTFAILMRVPVIGRWARTPNFRDSNCVLYQWSPSVDSAQA